MTVTIKKFDGYKEDGIDYVSLILTKDDAPVDERHADLEDGVEIIIPRDTIGKIWMEAEAFK